MKRHTQLFRANVALPRSSDERGVMLVAVLVYGFVFLMLGSSMLGYFLVQRTSMLSQIESERAFHIAEAGLEYYKWFLAHNPSDFTNGTGTSGPYVIDYEDPEGGIVGQYSLDIDGNLACGFTSSIDIRSTGYTLRDPARTRTVHGRYSRPTVAEYAYILNANVWAGVDREIYGPYHSNGGIRMDGTNYSTVTSGQTNWLCTSSFGCTWSQTKDGVFGAGSGSALWQFPHAPIDFAGLTVDLVDLKTAAQTYGYYFDRYLGQAPQRGYHIVFNGDDSFTLYGVSNSQRIWSMDIDNDWAQRYERITSETLLGTYTLSPDCSVIYVEDKVWIEGVVGTKVTVAVADIANPTFDTSVLLDDNITYSTNDGSVGLTVIAQQNILIPLEVPNDMTLNGIFISQEGRFGRNHYTTYGSQDVPSSLNSYVIQNSLTILGTIVSNGRVGTRWTSGGSTSSGFENRVNSYDAALANDPPPLTPATSVDYRLTLWREE